MSCGGLISIQWARGGVGRTGFQFFDSLLESGYLGVQSLVLLL
jgi:hypothetical protein